MIQQEFVFRVTRDFFTFPIVLKLQGSRSEVGHVAREMAKVYSVTFFISSSIPLDILQTKIDLKPHNTFCFQFSNR